jgi:hypothetical protein
MEIERMSSSADAFMAIFGFKRVEGGMKTIEETRRGMFEAWYREQQKKCWEESRDCPYLACFEAWCAALDAVVIELPDPHATNGRYSEIYLCETIAAIESTRLGLKIR